MHNPAGTATQAAADGDSRMQVGTLRYTMAGLLWVFVWLLWGDFCFTVMEYVNNSIVPLLLRDLKAPDWSLPVILVTIPSIINFILNPIISTASDRYRSRWGRRIPFLLFSAPFLSITLVMMAYSRELSAWLHGMVGPWGGWSLLGVSVFTVGFIKASFKVFDMFVNTAFWYLFNDVVPQAFMARFMGMFRVVANVAAMGYNYFFYEHALTHMKGIYLGAAAIYGVGFTLMCLFVKEGQYPPPKPKPADSRGFFARTAAEMKVYVRQCLSHRLYIFYFLTGMFMMMANAASVFGLYLNLSLGITLKQLAVLNTGIQFMLITLNYPAGSLADRFHPMRIWLIMLGCLLVVVPLNFVWLFGAFPAERYFDLQLFGHNLHMHVNLAIVVLLTAVDLPITLLLNAVGMPLMMRLLPRDQFGQFCSFNALSGAVMNILGSVSVAWFMTSMRNWLPDDIWGKDFCYRMIPAWRMPFLCITMVCLWLLYREWKRQGGETHYKPPAVPGVD